MSIPPHRAGVRLSGWSRRAQGLKARVWRYHWKADFTIATVAFMHVLLEITHVYNIPGGLKYSLLKKGSTTVKTYRYYILFLDMNYNHFYWALFKIPVIISLIESSSVRCLTLYRSTTRWIFCSDQFACVEVNDLALLIPLAHSADAACEKWPWFLNRGDESVILAGTMLSLAAWGMCGMKGVFGFPTITTPRSGWRFREGGVGRTGNDLLPPFSVVWRSWQVSHEAGDVFPSEVTGPSF